MFYYRFWIFTKLAVLFLLLFRYPIAEYITYTYSFGAFPMEYYLTIMPVLAFCLFGKNTKPSWKAPDVLAKTLDIFVLSCAILALLILGGVPLGSFLQLKSVSFFMFSYWSSIIVIFLLTAVLYAIIALRRYASKGICIAFLFTGLQISLLNLTRHINILDFDDPTAYILFLSDLVPILYAIGFALASLLIIKIYFIIQTKRKVSLP